MPIADYPLVPLVYPAAFLLKLIRKAGVHRLPMCKRALMQVGVFPIRDHYYEPQFDMSQLRRHPSEERELPGIDWNIDEQLTLLDKLRFASEFVESSVSSNGFKFNVPNDSFGSGDAEFFYQIIRLKKPKRIFEIGSGNSTKVAMLAIQANSKDDPEYRCRHVCIEPFEMPWLEDSGVEVVRKKVETLGVDFFDSLQEDDILFIDSSHIIRPDGDVLFEYLELLPTLNPGVIVHVHDIFSPRNYLKDWLDDRVRFWNEQYVLESFLTHNSNWRIVASLNLLHHRYQDELKRVCPYVTPDREPGSFYLQKAA